MPETATMKMLYDPRTCSDVGIEDARDSLDHTTQVAASLMEIQGFMQRRRTLVQEIDVTTYERKCSPTVPAPGGVGAGVYFKQDILGFETTTTIFWRIVAPEFLGGSSGSLVYITASNQAAKGPEALVSYRNHGRAVFRIWDWATPPQANGSRFVFGLAFKDWGHYRIPHAINGGIHDTLYVANRTHGSGTSWTNEVMLFNSETQMFDLVWNRSFQWVQDPSHKFFGWGPIIEPFPPFNFDAPTNLIGFADATLVSDRFHEPMSPLNSSIVNRNIGFDIKFLEPNRTMLAS